MDPIAEIFIASGFTYQLLARSRRLALYSQTNAAGVVRYEVVRIQETAAHVWPNGQEMPAHESYPPATSWGRHGWTFFTRQSAEAQMARLGELATQRMAQPTPTWTPRTRPSD